MQQALLSYWHAFAEKEAVYNPALQPLLTHWDTFKPHCVPLFQDTTPEGPLSSIPPLTHYVAQPTPKALDDSQQQALSHLLTLQPGDIQAIETPVFTGKERLIQAYVSSCWVNAAVHQTDPPRILLTTPHGAAWRLKWQQSIDFEDPLAQSWLPDFLKCYQRLSRTRIPDLATAITQIHQTIITLHTTLLLGLKKASQRSTVLQRLQTLYPEGVEARLATLQQQDQRLEAELEQLQAEDRETKSTFWKTVWLQPGQRRRAEQTYQQGIENIRAKRALLHQTLIPVCMHMAEKSRVELAWLQFQQMQGEADWGDDFLDKTFRYPLHLWTQHYWEARSLLSDIPPYVTVASPTDVVPNACLWHTWIADEASHLSSLYVLPYHCQRAIALTDNTLSLPPCHTTPAEEQGLCEAAGLEADETALEELEFNGYLISQSSWGRLASLKSRYQETDFTQPPGTIRLQLRYNTETRADILSYVQSNGYIPQVVAASQIKARYGYPAFNYLHIKNHMASEGEINRAEVGQIILWLQVHKHPAAIVTPFSAQKEALQQALQEAALGDIPVWTFSELNGKSAPWVIFSPVCTTTSPRPFVFDTQPSLLNRVALCAKEGLMVMGDMEIFDPNTHSPSGKLAKWLFSKPEHALSQHQLYPQVGLPVRTRCLIGETLLTFLQDCFQEAKQRIVLSIPQLSAEEAPLCQTLIESAERRGVEVVLYVGSAVSLTARGIRLIHNLHSHYGWYDNAVFFETAHPWFSTPNGLHRYVNVYQGAAALELIQAVLFDLHPRTQKAKVTTHAL